MRPREKGFILTLFTVRDLEDRHFTRDARNDGVLGSRNDPTMGVLD